MENIKRNLFSYFFRLRFLILFFLIPFFSESKEFSPEFYLKDEGDYLKIICDYQLISKNPGFPQIPVIRRTDVDKVLKIKLIEEDTIQLSKRLIPLKFPVSKNSKHSLILKPDEKIYNSDTRIVGKDFSFNSGILEIYPFDYIPSKNLLVVKHFDVDYKMKKSDKTTNRKILIIYSPSILNDTSSIKNYYLVRGYQPIIKNLDSIGTTSSEIKTFIKNLYTTNPFSFLLLIGGSSYIPIEYGNGESNPATDLYYSLIDTIDYFPDIIISRLPFVDSISCKNYFEKSIYLSNNDQFYRIPSSYFIATDDGGYHALVESTHIYSMNLFRSVNILTDSLFGFYQTGTRIDTSINRGKDIVVYSGHGATYYWAGPYFYQTDIEKLENEIYPDIFSFACYTGNYTYENFFGHSWLSAQNKGGLSFTGASVETYWDEDDILQRFFIDSLKNFGYIFDKFNQAKVSFFNHYGDLSLTKGYFERYNYFSTPERFFGNRFLNNFTLDYDRFVPYNELFNVKVQYDGNLDSPIFTSIFKLNDSLVDSKFVSLPSLVELNTTGIIKDSLKFFTFIEGRKLFSDTIFIIGDGPYVTIKDYYLSNYYLDTLYFDLVFKNFGNQNSDSSKVFFKANSTDFEIITDTLYLPPLNSESTFFFYNGLVLKVSGFSDSLTSQICSVFTVSGNDTLSYNIPLTIMPLDFTLNYINTIFNDDTIYGIPKSVNSKIFFNIDNTSALQVKDLKVKIVSNDLFISSPEFTIPLISGNSSYVFGVDVFSNLTLSQKCLITLILQVGDWTKEFYVNVPFIYIDKPQYYGPQKGVYIYSNKMDYLKNAPVFKNYNLDSIPFKQLYVKDDTTISIKLPFKFKFFGISRDTLFLNTNGLLSFSKLDNSLFTPTNLPSEYLKMKNTIVFAWNDFRPSFFYDTYSKRSETSNNVFTYFDTTDFSYLIYFNRVISPDYMYNTFVVSIETTSVTVHFIDVADPSLFITGVQFYDETFLSFTGDSFFDQDGFSLIHSKVSIKFTTDKPKLKSKEFDFTRPFDKKVSMNFSLFSKNYFYFTVHKNGRYSIEIYDIYGRRESICSSGLFSENVYKIPLNLESSGIKFIVVKDINGNMVERKKIVFLK